MLTFSPPKIFQRKKKKSRLLFPSKYKLPTANEIRAQAEKLSSCPKCHFLIFDNYWTDEIENRSTRLCPTCGTKL